MCIYGGGVWVLVETSNSTLARWRLEVRDAWHVEEFSFDKITVINTMLYTDINNDKHLHFNHKIDRIGQSVDL